MTETLVITELRNYLVSLGLVRLPNTVGDAPVCWLHLAEGLEQPDLGAGETAVVELRRTSYVAQPPYVASTLDEGVIECTVRAHTSPQAELLQNQIRRAVDDQRNWEMAALHVEWSYVFRPTFWLGSDSYSYDSRQSFRIAATRASLGV